MTSESKLRGVIVTLKEKESRVFGFIKANDPLPEGYVNKNVYFNPGRDKFGVGDEVEFILSNKDKGSPSARRVWLLKQADTQKNNLFTEHQGVQTVGKITAVKHGAGWITVQEDVPKEFQSRNPEKIFFREEWVSCAQMDLMPGDIVKLTIKPSKKSDSQLSAHYVRLVECSPRSSLIIKGYIDRLSRKLANATDTETGLVLNLLSSSAVWTAIGQCQNMSLDVLVQVLDFMQLLSTKGYQSNFKQAIKVLASTQFFGGQLRPLIEDNWNHLTESVQEKVKAFLLMLLQNIPERSRLVIGLLKPMLSEGNKNIEHFLYQLLKNITSSNQNDISEMDWNELPLVPTISELINRQADPMRLKEVKVKGPYEDAEDYVDTYFRLLRADCFSALQEGIENYLNRTLDPRDMSIYTRVTLVGVNISNKGNGIALALKVTPQKAVKKWERSSNLMFGNLLCLSPSGLFNDPIWATVADRDVKLLASHQTVWVNLCDEANTKESAACLIDIHNASGRIVMAESPSYYIAYQPVLKAIQQIKPETLAFQEELLHLNSGLSPPHGINPDEVRLPETMDGSQKNAFRQAFENRVAVIQGPPGTGKTYIGIKLVQQILSSTSLKLPILVLTYKNHALDEFLKEVIELRQYEVVRVGGRSQDPILEEHNLQKLRKTRAPHNGERFTELRLEASEMKGLVTCAVQAVIQAKMFSLKTFLQGFTEQQIDTLLKRCPKNMYLFDESTNMGRTVETHELLKLWQEGKCFLLDENIPLEERYRKSSRWLVLFIKTAMMMWLPKQEQFLQMMPLEEKIPCFMVTNESETKAKKEKDGDDSLLSEKDIEDEEKERFAAFSRSVAKYTVDIDIQREKQKSEGLPQMFSSAEKYAERIPLVEIELIQDLWSLSPYEKAVLVQILLWHQKAEAEKALADLSAKRREVLAALEEVENEHKTAILLTQHVVGMTITGASIHQPLLQMLRPSVVLVEEAAEVLEPQLTAVIGNWVKHLILIGDHMQLRPQVQCFNLCRNNHFDVSMMERLINNGYPHATLAMQNRMRPEMAELLLDIYPELQSNLKRVEVHKPPDFTTSSMYFWSHEDPEKHERSYFNEGEAKRVIQLALFFIQMGYEPCQITILAAYQGQVSLLRKMFKQAQTDHPEIFSRYKDLVDSADGAGNRPNAADHVTIHTVDSYQGDENDIVIVSLVRSNDSGRIGFTGTLNRRCVAQSRARCGMYIVGNSATFLEARQSCWMPVISKLNEMKLVGQQFPIHCPVHKELTQIKATTADDIPLKKICKIICNQQMECQLHMCTQPCQPRHSHDRWSCEHEISFVHPCGHLGTRKCYQPEESIHCGQDCEQIMDCEKHQCTKPCYPKHSHGESYCTRSVRFVFSTCEHAGEKLCSQMESDVKCSKKVLFKFKKCNHHASRLCWQQEKDVTCKSPCARTLICGHPCEGICGDDPCDASKCDLCKQRRMIEMQMKRKQEEIAREAARNDAKRELDQLRSLGPGPPLSRIDLLKEGDTASEYYDVEDRVKKYVQPSHNWFPEVTKIEKITNSKLQERWLEAKSQMFDPLRSELKFHGTNATSIESIIRDGFMIQKTTEKKSMYGNGIYFATDSSKSAQQKYTKGSNMLLLCNVLLGKSHTVKKANHDMTFDILHTAGYDSLFAPRQTVGTGGVLNDEYVVFRSEQALPTYIVHYRNCGISSISTMPSPAPKGKHTLYPKRGFDPRDPLDMHFRCAESQFMRLTKKSGSNDQVKSVELYINPQLQATFDAKRVEFQKKYPQTDLSEPVLAFHGTPVQNIPSIMDKNFDMAYCKTGAYGAGIYLSEFPDVSEGYARGEKKLILCYVLPGEGFRQGTRNSPLRPGYDSHTVKEDDQGRAWAHVIFDPAQILPMYVINY